MLITLTMPIITSLSIRLLILLTSYSTNQPLDQQIAPHTRDLQFNVYCNLPVTHSLVLFDLLQHLPYIDTDEQTCPSADVSSHIWEQRQHHDHGVFSKGNCINNGFGKSGTVSHQGEG